MTTHVAVTTESPATWAARPFIPPELRSTIVTADILLVPTEGYPGREDLRFFPQGTREIFNFLKARVPEGVHVEVCATDEDYHELARHAAVLYLGEFIVTNLLAPVVAGLLLDWVMVKLGKRGESANIKTALTLRDETEARSVRLDYEGPASEFKETVLATIKQLKEEASQPTLPPANEQSRAEPTRTDQSTPAEVPRQDKH